MTIVEMCVKRHVLDLAMLLAMLHHLPETPRYTKVKAICTPIISSPKPL